MANLKQWPPGVSGNPKGRPKAVTLSEMLRKQLAQTMPNADGRTFAEEIARVLCVDAAAGSLGAIREVCDRVEGRPRQGLDLGMETDGASALVVIQMPDNGRADRVNYQDDESADPLQLPPYGA